MGFRNIEFYMHSEYEYNLQYIADTKKLIDLLGINVNTAHSYSTAFEHYLLFSHYERRRGEGFRIFTNVCQAARMIGAKYLSFHGITNFLTNIPDSLCIDVYHELVDIAKRNDIVIAQENVSYCRSSEIEFLKLLKKEFSPEELKLTLDIKQAVRAGKNVYDYIDVMGDRIVNIHTNDNILPDVHCLLPGAGNFDYDTFFKKLKDIGYNNTFTIEVYRQNFDDISEVADSKAFLDEKLQKYFKYE